MFDLTQHIGGSSKPVPLWELPEAKRRETALKSIDKISTPDLQKLYQSTGNRLIAIHNGVIPGDAEEYDNLRNGVEVFKQTLKRRENEVAAGLRTPETGVRAEAIKKYNTELTERIETVCGTYGTHTMPSLKKATDVSKYMAHQTEDAYIAAKAKNQILVDELHLSRPEWLESLEHTRQNFIKNALPGIKKLAEQAELLTNITKNRIEKGWQDNARNILEGLESKGINPNQAIEKLLKSGLPQDEQLAIWLKKCAENIIR